MKKIVILMSLIIGCGSDQNVEELDMQFESDLGSRLDMFEPEMDSDSMLDTDMIRHDMADASADSELDMSPDLNSPDQAPKQHVLVVSDDYSLSCNEVCKSENLMCDGMYMFLGLPIAGIFVYSDEFSTSVVECDRVPEQETTGLNGTVHQYLNSRCQCI